MRVVVIGMGVQGTKRARIAGSEVVAKIDPIAKDAEYTDIREVPLETFDAALICTPDDAKIEISRYLLENSKHLLVEKPLLAADPAQLLTLRDLAKKKNLACYTAYNHRFEPCLHQAQQIVESGEIGQILSFRMFYGNGTARLVRESVWRDQGMGVLADLGSHLLDTLYFILREQRHDLVPYCYSKLENRAYDYVLFGSKTDLPKVHLEATLLSWKNESSLDIIGTKGSIHTRNFCKWGPSSLITRLRVLPSGAPHETIYNYPQGDPTWGLEYSYFKEQVKNPSLTIDRDIWINSSLNSLHSNSVCGV